MENSSDNTIQKLLLDKPLDFKFHAAYVAYSEAWDNNPSEEARAELNEIIPSLKREEMSYDAFYNRLEAYRKDKSARRSRVAFKTQSKKDWRRSEHKKQREARYRR
jgi:hypothetical protein